MTIRVGFMGAGLIATFHSMMLKGSGEDVTWGGVYDPDGERAAAFAAASGATACATEDEVFDSCDAVYVCTWTSEHHRLVKAAVDRGLPVFCEKPLAPDLASAQALVDDVLASGVVNQCGLVLRRSPAFNLAKALREDPAAGAAMAVIFRDDQFIPTQGHYASTWRADRERAGAGTLIEHSIHDIDMLEHVVGRVTSVAARSANHHGHDGIEDVVTAQLTFADGAIGNLTSIWHDVLSRPSLRRVEVHCANRWIHLEDDWFGPLTWMDPEGEAVTVTGQALLDACTERGIATPNPDGDFIQAVRDGTPAWPDVTVALRAHEIVDACYRSAAQGGTPIPV